MENKKIILQLNSDMCMQEEDESIFYKNWVLLKFNCTHQALLIHIVIIFYQINTTIAEKINFKAEVLHKKAMWHECDFLLSCNIWKSGLIFFLHSSVHLLIMNFMQFKRKRKNWRFSFSLLLLLQNIQIL